MTLIVSRIAWFVGTMLFREIGLQTMQKNHIDGAQQLVLKLAMLTAALLSKCISHYLISNMYLNKEEEFMKLRYIFFVPVTIYTFCSFLMIFLLVDKPTTTEKQRTTMEHTVYFKHCDHQFWLLFVALVFFNVSNFVYNDFSILSSVFGTDITAMASGTLALYPSAFLAVTFLFLTIMCCNRSYLCKNSQEGVTVLFVLLGLRLGVFIAAAI